MSLEDCTCGNIGVGDGVIYGKNWSASCPEHGMDSEWWNSEEQRYIREERSRQLRELQKKARWIRGGGKL